MRITIEPFLARLALLLLGALLSTVARAHGDAGGGPVCQLRLGAWRMDVALYQPSLHDGDMFCDALPGPGATVLVFDAVDDALTHMPVEIRILDVRGGASDTALEAQDERAIDAATVARAAPDAGRRGTLTLRHEFKDTGTYVALLRAAAPNGGEWRAAWRFTVGNGTLRARQVALGAGLSVLVCALLAWARRPDAPAGPAGDPEDIGNHPGTTRLNS